MKINTKKFLHKTVAATTILCCLTENVLFTPIAYAGQAKAGVEETLYLNLDYYGEVSAANMVKAITFNGTDSYTDYGDYTNIINMTDDQKLTSKDGKVVIQAPTNSTKLYFQGAMDKAKAAAQLPWTFDISYKLNGKPVNADTLSGASGLVEIDIDATANKNVAEYLQNNIVLAVMVPVDMEKNYSLDAPDAQTANMGDKSGVVFTCLPGQDGHFEVRIGSDDFKLYGVMFVMSPITVSDLDKVKDLKDLEDRFRGDTNSMMDSFDDILDDVANMQSQLDLTDKALNELKSGKDKVHKNATAIFNGTDVAIQDLRDVETLLTPISDDLKTAQWMVYDINTNLNTTNEDLADASSKLKTLSTRFKQFGEDLDGASNLDIQDASGDIKKTIKALENVNDDIKTASHDYVASPSQIVSDFGTASTARLMKKAESEANFTSADKALLSAYLANNSGTSVSDLSATTLAPLLAVAEAGDDSATTKLKYLDYIQNNSTTLTSVQTAATTLLRGLQTQDQNELIKLLGYAEKVQAGEVQIDSVPEKYRTILNEPSTYGTALQTVGTVVKNLQDAGYNPTKMLTYAKAAGTPSTEAVTKARNFVNALKGSTSTDGTTTDPTATIYGQSAEDAEKSLSDLKDTAENLTSTTTGSDVYNLASSINDLSTALQEYYEADTDRDGTELAAAIDDVCSKLTEIMESGGALSFQAARVTNSIRDLIGDMDSLIGIMNSYYDDVQKSIEDGDNLIAEIQKTSDDTASVLQTVNNTLRSAEPDFSAAADDSISVGHEAIENGGKMIDHTNELKETGHGLRDAINDKLDEEEADNNFINMDPDAPKVSLTSADNQEPTNISIVCRSDEIKSAEEAESLDSEVESQGTTFWQRIANVFITIWNTIKKLFASDD